MFGHRFLCFLRTLSWKNRWQSCRRRCSGHWGLQGESGLPRTAALWAPKDDALLGRSLMIDASGSQTRPGWKGCWASHGPVVATEVETRRQGKSGPTCPKKNKQRGGRPGKNTLDEAGLYKNGTASVDDQAAVLEDNRRATPQCR